MAGMDTWTSNDLFARVRCRRRTRPQRADVRGVLDMLSAATRPMNSRSCGAHHVGPRARDNRRTRGREALAIANAGTIPDRGCTGVLAVPIGRIRVAELDERWSSRATRREFTLGASTWRIEEITHAGCW